MIGRDDGGVVQSVVMGGTSGLTAVERARHGTADAVRVVIAAPSGSVIEHVTAAIGYRATVATLEAELVPRLDRAQPHAVLLDASDPAAAEMLATLVQHRSHPPVIAIDRSHGPRGDGDRWLAAGADDYLTIDQLTPAILRRTVESAIARGRARDLRARVSELDRLAAIATLAAGVAHEVNNPAAYVLMNLTTCREHVGTLREGLAGADGDPAALAGVLDEMTEMLDDNIRGLERIVAIVQSLRAFARPEPDRAEEVDLGAMCREVNSLLSSQLRHRARVVLDLAPVPAIVADARKLSQVVINLLVGAAEAIPPGEGNHEIRLRLRERDGWIELAVADTGRPLTPEERAHAFEPFYAGRGAASTGGLGMATVRSVVERLGGKVTAVASGPRGAEFVARLPVRGPTAATAVPEPVTDDRRARVLIIDDEVALTRAMRRQLRGHHDVTIENDVAAAMARLADEDYDVVLCDVMMPGTDGLGLLESLRRSRPELVGRLVLMTAGTTDPIRELVLARGGQLIDKPVPLDALLALIAGVQQRAGTRM